MSQSGYTRVVSRLSCDMRALKVLHKCGLFSWLMRGYQGIRLGIDLCVWQWCRLVIDPLLSVIWAIRLSDVDSSNTSLSGSKSMRYTITIIATISQGKSWLAQATKGLCKLQPHETSGSQYPPERL